MHGVLQVTVVAVGVGLIVWGAEAFAEHLSVAAVRLGVSAFALAVLLAGGNEDGRRRVGKELGLVVAGVAAMATGAVLVVDGVRRLSHVESTQTRLGLVLVGFATAFELVVLAWSAARRGMSEAVVAGVVGSFAYNVTMSLGAGAVARPLRITGAGQLHGPWIAMIVALVGVLALSLPRRRLDRRAGLVLLGAYPVIALAVLVR